MMNLVEQIGITEAQRHREEKLPTKGHEWEKK
jgi:hypothetical protein